MQVSGLGSYDAGQEQLTNPSAQGTEMCVL